MVLFSVWLLSLLCCISLELICFMVLFSHWLQSLFCFYLRIICIICMYEKLDFPFESSNTSFISILWRLMWFLVNSLLIWVELHWVLACFVGLFHICVMVIILFCYSSVCVVLVVHVASACCLFFRSSMNRSTKYNFISRFLSLQECLKPCSLRSIQICLPPCKLWHLTPIVPLSKKSWWQCFTCW